MFDFVDYVKCIAMMAKKKNRMGRPPKNVSERLSEIVTLRMTPADHGKLMKDARESGLSVSAYLQACWRKVEG